MNSDLLALLSDPEYHLNEVIQEDAEAESDRKNILSFEKVSEDGEVVGYIKAWHDSEDYAGFVHFDTQGNIVDWKAFNKSPRSKSRVPSNLADYT